MNKLQVEVEFVRAGVKILTTLILVISIDEFFIKNEYQYYFYYKFVFIVGTTEHLVRMIPLLNSMMNEI